METQDFQLNDGSTIADLQEDTTYKYLGVEENSNIQHKLMRSKIHTAYLQRVKKICKSELTTKNKITAINQFALPVVTYGFGVVDWPQKHLNTLDIKTRKMLTLHKVIYRNQCHDRIYLPRSEGGMGLQGVSDSFRATIVSLGQYLLSNRDPLIQMVAKQHKDDLPQNVSIIKMAKNYADHLIEEEPDPATPATVHARSKRVAYGFEDRNMKKERWKNHKRAGLFPQELEKPYIDKEESFKWLKKGKLGYENEKIILAAQDQGLMTNGFKKMAKISQNDQCRFCHAAVESTSHLVSACQIMLADGHCTARHNKVCRYIHWAICNHYKIDTQPVWLHEPQPLQLLPRT